MNTRDLILKFQGGGSSLPREDLVQHLVPRGSSITKNPDTGIYELIDKVGKETRPIQDGRCWNFDGESNYVELDETFNLGTVFKASAFFKLSDVALANQTIIGSNTTVYLLSWDGSNGRFVIYLGSGFLIYFPVSLSDGWHHVEINKDGLDTYIRLDNVIINPSYPPTVNKAWNYKVKIGIRDTDRFFTGSMRSLNINDRINFICEEQSGNIARSIDTSHATGTIHGTIAGFHAIDKTREDSRCNDIGYAIKSGIDGLIPLDVNGNPTVADCDTVYKGRVKYNEKVIGTNCLNLDGSTNKTNIPVLTIDSTKSFNFNFNFKRSSGTVENVFLGNSNNSSYLLQYHPVNKQFGIFNGSVIYFDCEIVADILYNIELKYNNPNGILTVINLESQTVVFQETKDIKSYLPTVLNQLFARQAIRFVNGYISDFNLTLDGVKVLELKLAEGNDNKVYNKVDGAEYTVAGIVDGIWQQDTTGLLRPSNMLDGFDLWHKDADGTRLEIPFDINGNSITTISTKASSFYNFSPINLFDNTSSQWVVSLYATPLPAWVEFSSNITQVLTEYTLSLTDGDMTRLPKKWDLQAWNGNEWVTLDTRSNITNWVSGIPKTFQFANTQSFSKYRLYITKCGSEVYLKLSTIDFGVNANGSIITGYTWKSRNPAGPWLNGSENSLLGYPSPVMRNKVDKDIELIYDSAGDVKAYSPDELQFDQEDNHKEFANINNSTKIKDIVRYKEPLTGSSLARVNKFIKKP